jgi:hypothetical protein
MKLTLLSLFVATCILVSCKGKNQGTTITSEDGKSSVTIDAKNMASAADQMEERIEELKKLPPLTLDQVKANLPEALLGIKRTRLNANSAMGFSVGEAEYHKDDSTYLQLSVYDVAGEAGSGIYALQFWGAMNMQSESEDGYTKTVDYNGKKAVEKFDKNSNSYDLTYLANDRLMVNLKGRNTGLDMLKQAANDLHFTTN